VKKIAVLILLALITEYITFHLGMVRHIESFFFVWGTLYLGVFLLTLFRVDTSTYSLRFPKSLFRPRTSEDIIASRNNQAGEKSYPVALIFMAIMIVGNLSAFYILMPKS